MCVWGGGGGGGVEGGVDNIYWYTERNREMFYLTTHSTVIWRQTYG